MDWSLAKEVWEEVQVQGYLVAQMTETDVESAVQRIRGWYPDIRVGMESPHLTAEFWTQETTLAGTVDKNLLPLKIEHEADGIVAVITYEKNALARLITSRLGVLAPEHRGSGLALLGPLLLERIGRAIGAELAYYFATLKTRHQQVIAERAGYQLVGIVPGYDRDMVRPGEVKRVFEAIYARLLVSEDEVLIPAAEHMTSRTKEVWEALFTRLPI